MAGNVSFAFLKVVVTVLVLVSASCVVHAQDTSSNVMCFQDLMLDCIYGIHENKSILRRNFFLRLTVCLFVRFYQYRLWK